jgi:hypothetical protein
LSKKPQRQAIRFVQPRASQHEYATVRADRRKAKNATSLIGTGMLLRSTV